MRVLFWPLLRGPRRPAAAAWLVLSLLLLASCARETIPAAGTGPQPPAAGPQAPLAVTPGAAAPETPEAAGAGKVKIGMLLPLTGSSAALGQAMLDAAQMALYDLADDRLELVIRDTGGLGPTA